MKIPFKQGIGLILSCMSLTVAAQAAGSFAADHMINVLKVKECRQRYELGVLKASAGEVTAEDAYKKYLQCRSAANEVITKTYDKMGVKLKSKSQKAALKEYQLAMKMSLEGSEPKGDELKSQYNSRVGRLDEDVERNWQRLLLE